MKVVINVIDVNDNVPKFVSNVFTGGVTTAADFGAQFMHVKATDEDVGENGLVKYYQIGKIHMTLAEGLDNIHSPPFLVDVNDGGIRLNFDPQKGMKGYFDFIVLANDTDGLQDVARVFIYLLREDQRVKFILRQSPPEIRDNISVFRETLGNVTDSIVNVDDFKIHVNRDGTVDKTKTDLYMHLVNPKDHSIMEVPHILRLIDQNTEALDSLFKEFNVLDTQAAEAVPLSEDFMLLAGGGRQAVAWLASISLFLAATLVFVLVLCLTQRSSYKHKLKTARASVFGNYGSSPDSGIVSNDAITGRVPNTNKHSVEGSNPMWLQAYENEWFKQEEEFSQTSETDSLDENILVDESYSPRNNDNPTSPAENLNNEYNVYQQLHKISNSQLLGKKLETTEL